MNLRITLASISLLLSVLVASCQTDLFLEPDVPPDASEVPIDAPEVPIDAPEVPIDVPEAPIDASLVDANLPFGPLVAEVKARNPGAGDAFGTTVAVDGDTLVIGAYGEDSAARGIDGAQNDDSLLDAGAVYVFRRSSATWQQEAYIKASNTDRDDRFGVSVALDGDTLVVGAPHEASAALGIDGDQDDNSAPHAGAVYVFRRSGTSWQQEAYIKGSNIDAGAWFGYSVALDGDTLAVGAFYSGGGSAYVFRRSGTSWQQEAFFQGANTDAGDQFGRSVALEGDTLAVGAQREDSGATGINGDEGDDSATDSGAVYVFRRSGTSWQQEAYVKASNTGEGDHFGKAVTLAGDTLAVGAIYEDSMSKGVNGGQNDQPGLGIDSGATYVYRRSGTTWAQEAYIKASNTESDDYFGDSVALWGDTLAVGARFEASGATGINGNQDDESSPGSGAVYVYQRSGATWVQGAYVKSTSSQGGIFGVSVALSADTLAVGASGQGADLRGGAYAFY
jgi:hypothetical protein